MRACTKVATAICLVANALASSNNYPFGNAILRADDVLERPYSAIHNTNGAAPSTPVLTRRDTAASAAGSLNTTTAWSAATDAACTKALSVLPRSSNPTGNCICYNLPALDTKTGFFEADLRLYRISEPRDDFANIPPENVKVGLQYHGASVSPISEKELMAMGLVSNQTQMVTRRDDIPSGGPRLVQTYMFVGQIDAAKLSQNMTMAALEEVLIPTFTLSATTPRGADIKTNISLNEASFLTGVFSKSVVLSDFSAAQAAVSAQLDALHNGTHAFILPGVQLMIFPTGTIITSIWLVLGLAAYGLGTFERISYAAMYKRRVADGGRKRV
ncbi:hypothetical protein C2857_002888 [Epichloe festucae Fl1]|uniref:Uncharacterized protein n=1 Tax=Epichloe festucae (strain Fl1) TaxID=877507 RepID=A0A7S9KUP4_EPIFF|nr:hypothetical protein C2857_002888 [Epichloe festucae Fl1]